MEPQKARRVSTTVLAIIVVAVVAIAAVAGGLYYYYATKTTPSSPTYKLALVVGGDETDLGFNDAAIQTAQMMQTAYGWQVSISRDVQYAQQGQVLASYAQQGYNVVWAHGGQFLSNTIFTGGSATVESKYNNTLFIQSPGPSATELQYSNIKLPSNIVVLGPSFQVTGYYLAGALAANMTKTGNVAVVIGQWYDYLSEEFYAFDAGVNATNTSTQVYASVPGTWSDPTTGYNVAQTLIQTNKVDILANIADATGRGVVAATEYYNKTAIGTVEDQVTLAPQNTMTSVMANFTAFVAPVIQSVMKGTFGNTYGGKVVEMNLGFLAPYHFYANIIPQSVQTRVSSIATQIANGQITVPQIIKQNPPSGPI